MAGFQLHFYLLMASGLQKVRVESQVEELILGKGHRVMFIPKFHCEINPFERVWCSAKQYTRAHCDYTFQGLDRTAIEKALDSVNVEMIRKYFRKVREYHRAYRNNIEISKEMQKALKVYKSHRRISEVASQKQNGYS